MTVGQLISELLKYPRDRQVTVVGIYCSSGDVEKVVEESGDDYKSPAGPDILLESDICSG
jgi:hypothetical protein